MNVVALTGRLSSDPTMRELPTGSVLMNFELTTRVDDIGVSVPLAWFDPPQKVSVAAGDEIVLILLRGLIRILPLILAVVLREAGRHALSGDRFGARLDLGARRIGPR